MDGRAGGNYERRDPDASGDGDPLNMVCWAFRLALVEKAKMTNEEIAGEVDEILRGYRVQQHWVATSEQRKSLYAIWHGSKAAGTLQQVIEPTSHKEAQEMRINLIISDIIDLVEKARKS